MTEIVSTGMGRTDLIPPPGFVPVWTKKYLHKMKYEKSIPGVPEPELEGLAITSLPADNDVTWLVPDSEELGFTTAKWMAHTIGSHSGEDSNCYTAISTSHIPSDMSYRNAWRYDPNADIGNGGKGIGISILGAKELAKDIIRFARGNKLGELDVEFQRALEVGADTSAIVAKKQILRDLPGQVDALNVTETTLVGVTNQIRSIWDTDLLGNYTYEDGIVIIRD